MVMGADNPARDQKIASPPIEENKNRRPKRRAKRWTLSSLIHSLAPARLTSRIILINVLGLVILVAGILYFNQTRKGLIAAREESLMTQAKIMAAALASTAAADTDSFSLDPDVFLEQQLDSKNPAGTEGYQNFEFPINPEQAGRVLRQLVSSTTTRARVFDRDGQMIVDSRHFYGRGEILRFDLPPINTVESNTATRWWTQFNAWLFANNYPLQKPYGLDNGKEFSEIRLALTGLPITKKAVNDKNEIIIVVAVPIQRFKAVQGALILSTKGGEIDDVLRQERKVVFLTFIVAMLVAVMLSLSLAGHIAEPVRRLSAAADKIRRGVHNRVEIPDFTYRRDEVGNLSGSLRDMTESLYRRIDAIEAFAADVAHELKNPLTSLRSAVETLELAHTKEQQQRLIDVVKDDVKRLDRLISDISDASRLDAELVRDRSKPVDLRDVLQTLIGMQQNAADEKNVKLALEVTAPRKRFNPRNVFTVMGHDNRLGQVVINLLSNALSFAPENSTITVRLTRVDDTVEFSVLDEGPGIPQDNLEKIFNRFYTDRPEYAFGKNSGLGLSISRQIILAYGGSIVAKNRKTGKGAQFVVVLPVATGPVRNKNANA
jgi:two-component system sensor histidine kinase ChvG